MYEYPYWVSGEFIEASIRVSKDDCWDIFLELCWLISILIFFSLAVDHHAEKNKEVKCEFLKEIIVKYMNL